MPIVSFLNQKGGVGKTTLAVNTTREFILRGKKSLLIDTDPQGSSMDWHERSQGDLIDIICLSKPTLNKDAPKFKSTYEWIFIDGIGKVESMMASAVACSDIVLIPVEPSSLAIWATKDIVELVKQRQELAFNTPKAAFIISQQITGTKLSKQIRSELEAYGLHVFNGLTSQRVAYMESLGKGITVVDKPGPACDEMKNIVTELEEFAHGID